MLTVIDDSAELTIIAKMILKIPLCLPGTIHLGNLMVNPRVNLLYVVERDQARYDSMKDKWGDRMPPNVLPEDSDTVMADPR